MSDYEAPFRPDEDPSASSVCFDVFAPDDELPERHSKSEPRGEPSPDGLAADAEEGSGPDLVGPRAPLPAGADEVLEAVARAAAITGQPAPVAAPKVKRGRRTVSDEPLRRYAGQMSIDQFTAATNLLERIKYENKSDRSSLRRAMTINSLVRVAMSILLEHADDIHGRNESEALMTLRAAIVSDIRGGVIR